MDLDSMKYAELQALAKALGLKANVKAEKLLKTLKQHYNKEQLEQDDQNNGGKVEKVSPESVQVVENDSTAFVSTRRGKGKRTKRKISDTVTVDAKMPSDDAVEVASTPAEEEEGQHAKRKKLSSSKDPGEDEPPQETQSIEEKKQQKLDEDEAPVQNQTEKPQTATKVGKIPRLQKGKPSLKPITPNFKKLHEAQFNKMESIDSFFQRRTKQMETCRNPAKEVKKANPARTSLFSPALADNKKTTALEPRRRTAMPATKAPPKKKPAGKEDAPFRPSVLSTRRINVRFSEATFDNEHKKSLIKTPARMSLCVSSGTPKGAAAEAGKPKTAQTGTRTPSKPFLFTGNTSMSSTPGTQKKQNFDLKASLARPLSYKPHTGKLKPFGDVKENASANKSMTTNPRQDNYKQHKVQTREDRRTKTAAGRREKKDGLLGARRGLVMM
ncbi:unnamed protein product [Ophioblennius macclurei]